ncbi:S8 family serine peptidase, partial [candidate division WOR-3 bacterium]|nr:S8 family serine peptidase [candidate division WOR-3 bacterium]
MAKPCVIYPNDHHFQNGDQWGLNQTNDCDIDAPEAWQIFSGSTSIKIGIIDGGVENWHEDLSGKVTGDAGWGWDGHGFHCAGIAAAKTDNGKGIAGVDWNARINSQRVDGDDIPEIYNEIMDAVYAGCHILNNSWDLGGNSAYVRHAFANAYKLNRVAVAAMGNENSGNPNYPAAFGQGIIAVGATNQQDKRCNYEGWWGSNWGSHIAVVAPGHEIWSCVPYNSQGRTYYQPWDGTSMATPFVSGLASLLKGYKSSLYNDDIEQIIRISADDIYDPLDPHTSPGWDEGTGTGRINARKALDLLRSPYQLKHWTVYGGSEVAHGNDYEQWAFIDVPGLPPAVYYAKWYKVRKSVTFPSSFASTPYVWGRGIGTDGYSIEKPNFGMGWCRVVPGTVTKTSATLETYVYDVYNINFTIHIGWVPCSPSNVKFKYTALGELTTVNLSGYMQCTNPPGEGGTKDVYHFLAHLSWTYNGTLHHYELWRKLYRPNPYDPTGWTRIYYGPNTSKVDPYDFQLPQGAWYYVRAYSSSSAYVQSNTLYLETYDPHSEGGSQTAGSKISLIYSLSLHPNPARNDISIRF